MDVIKLVAIFSLIIILLKFKLPLSVSIMSGCLLTAILYHLGIQNTAIIIGRSMVSWSTLSVVLILYLITYLQRSLERRDHLNLAHHALSGLFNSRRINATLAPVFIGLLPSGGAMFICGSMVNNACEDYLSTEDKTFVTTYFRHIPESFLPTYGSIILAVNLSGVAVSSFLIAMFPMVVLLFVLGYLFYVHKVPKETGLPPSQDKKKDLLNLFKSLWSIALIIVLILFFNVSVYLATGISILLYLVINRFHPGKEVVPMFRSAFEPRLIINMFVVMIFKDVIIEAGAIEALPVLFAKLPVPTSAVFALVFFFGTIISGSSAIIAMCMPLAFATVPGAGLALFVLLMCYTYAAMQMSPTHVCLTLAVEYFRTNMNDLLKRTIPVIGLFCIAVAGYYLLLSALGF